MATLGLFGVRQAVSWWLALAGHWGTRLVAMCAILGVVEHLKELDYGGFRCLGALNPVCGMGESPPRVDRCVVLHSAVRNHRNSLSQSHQAAKL